MIAKFHTLFGLGLRKQDIGKSASVADEISNVRKTARGRLAPRFGFDEQEEDATYTPLAMIEANNLQELIKVNQEDTNYLQKYNEGTDSWDDIPFGGITISGVGGARTEIPDWVEYNDSLYLTDPTLVYPLMKYDGNTVYRAGVSNPSDGLVNFTGASGTTFMRVQYMAIDANSTQVASDYIEGDSTEATISNIASEGYKNKYALYSSGPGVDVTNETGNYVYDYSDTNVVAGDTIGAIAQKEVLGTGGRITNLLLVNLTVTAKDIVPGQLLLDPSDIPDGYSIPYTGALLPSYRFDLSSIFARAFVSSTALVNFTFAGFRPITSDTPNKVLNFADWTLLGNLDMTQVFDVSSALRPPPIAKYISLFQDQIVLSNIKREGDLSVNDKNSIMWSFRGVGGSPESFADYQSERIGDTSEGEITGSFGNEYRVTIMKQRQVYDLNGVLSGRNYTLRKLLTNGVGAVSHSSIVEIEGGCFYMTDRGIYAAGNGQKPLEASDAIEPLFRDRSDLDLTKTVAVNDVVNEELLFYIPSSTVENSIVLVYNYYFKEWFIWEGIIASGGIAYYQDTIWHHDSTKLYKRNSLATDDGVGIVAKYRSSWFDFDEPTLKKRFVDLYLLATRSDDFQANMKTEIDWEEDVFKTDSDIEISSSPYGHSTLDIQEARSIRVTFEMEGYFLIDGFQFDYSIGQDRPRAYK